MCMYIRKYPIHKHSTWWTEPGYQALENQEIWLFPLGRASQIAELNKHMTKRCPKTGRHNGSLKMTKGGGGVLEIRWD